MLVKLLNLDPEPKFLAKFVRSIYQVILTFFLPTLSFSCMKIPPTASQAFSPPKLASIRGISQTCVIGKVPNLNKQCKRTIPDCKILSSRDPLIDRQLGKAPILNPIDSESLPASTCKAEKMPGGALWQEETGHFLGSANKKIAYKMITRLSNQNKGDKTDDRKKTSLIVILPGYGETYLNYVETIFNLLSLDYEIAIMDHRGMGLSERLIQSKNIGYIDQFEHYINDTELFVEELVSKKNRNLYLLAHSTGGLIGTRVMVKNPTLFKKAILISPLMELNTGKLPSPLVCGIVNFCSLLGKDEAYAPGCSLEKDRSISFETNKATHSKERFLIKKRIRAEVPDSELGPPSNKWLRIIYQELNKLPQLAPKLETPTLIIQAGEDKVVGNPGQNAFCQKASHCKVEQIEKARHSIHLEIDELRDELFTKLDSFIKAN